LPDAIKDALVAGVIYRRTRQAVNFPRDPKLMLDLFKKILRESSTVRETEEMARQAKGEIQQKEPRTTTINYGCRNWMKWPKIWRKTRVLAALRFHKQDLRLKFQLF